MVRGAEARVGLEHALGIAEIEAVDGGEAIAARDADRIEQRARLDAVEADADDAISFLLGADADAPEELGLVLEDDVDRRALDGVLALAELHDLGDDVAEDAGRLG